MEFADFVISLLLIGGGVSIVAGVVEIGYWLHGRVTHPDLADHRADDQTHEGGIPR